FAHAHLEELVVRGQEHRRRGEESAAGVAVDADAIEIDPAVQRGKLFDAGLLIRQRVVTQVEVAEALIFLRPLRATAAIAELNDDEPELRELLRHGRWR